MNEKFKGVFGKRNKILPILCAIEGQPSSTGQGTVLAGTVSGQIYVFSDYKVVTKVSAHDAPLTVITRLYATSGSFLTGAKDGLVKIWSHDFKALYTYRMTQFIPRPFSLSCHAIASNLVGSSILVGMRGGEMYEVSLQSHTQVLLAEGHSHLDLHALAIHPLNSDEYATGGDDGVLRIWSLRRKYCLRRLLIDFACRALTYSPDGKVLVVGIGGVKAMASKEGAFMVINALNLEIIREERKAKQAITDIKFSASHNWLAFASSDGKIYLHSATTYDFKKLVEVTTIPCSITHMDFSADSSTLRMSSNLCELFYYSLDNAAPIASSASIRDMQWLTHSCPFSWNSQGVFRPADVSSSDALVEAGGSGKGSGEAKDGGNVAIIAPSVLSVCVHPSKRYIAASYSDGEVRIYRYPCQSIAAPYLQVRGVGTQASVVHFSCDGKHLIVLDSLCRVVLQYTVKNFSSDGV